jgi:hypothetical protein
MKSLSVAALRDFNQCAERSITRLNSSIQRLKQLKNMIETQRQDMLKDDTSPVGLRAIDLNGYGNQIQRVEEQLHAASLDLIGTAVDHAEKAEAGS